MVRRVARGGMSQFIASLAASCGSPRVIDARFRALGGGQFWAGPLPTHAPSGLSSLIVDVGQVERFWRATFPFTPVRIESMMAR